MENTQQPQPEHLCDGTDGDSTMCVLDWSGKHVIYGYCEDDNCGGMCDAQGDCKCRCHAQPHTWTQIGTVDAEGFRTHTIPGDVCVECSNFSEGRYVPVSQCPSALTAWELEHNDE